MLRPFKDFVSRQNLFKVLLHLSLWKKWCNLKKYAPPFYALCPILFQKSTASIWGLSLQVRLFQSTTTASIDAFYYTETVHSFTTCPTGLNYFAQCVRYSLNQILHLSLQARLFQNPAASIKAFCCKAMLHVLKEIPHHSSQTIPKCQFPGTFFVCQT